jgi:hypothetical protein
MESRGAEPFDGVGSKKVRRVANRAVLHDFFYRRGSPLRLHYGFERLRPIRVYVVRLGPGRNPG